jgi:hypothetical protein
VSVALYMDVHVSRQVSRGLRRRGVDVLTAQEDGTIEWSDAALLDRATSLGRVLVSQDADLLVEAARRQRQGNPFGGVIFAPQTALSVGDFIADLELLARAGRRDEFANTVQYLPLR